MFDTNIGVFAPADQDHYWFKASQGLSFRSLAYDQAPHPQDLNPEASIRIIPDTLLDPLTRQAPIVRDSGARFYAAMPLLVDNRFAMGALWLMDTRPRTWSAAEQKRFERFAALAVDLLQKRLDRQRMARRESEHVRNGLELNTILQTAAIGIVRIDEQGTIEAINPSVTQMFGYQPKDLLGRNVSILMPDPWRSGDDGHIAQYLATHDPKVIGSGRKVTGIHVDGRTFPLQLAVSEIRTEGQTQFVGFMTDLTALAQIESELESERTLLRSIIDSLTHPMSTVDLDGRLMLVNKILATCVGSSPDAMLGKPAEDFLPVEAIPIDRQENQRVIDTGQPMSLHAPAAMRGQNHIFETTKSPLRDSLAAMAGVVAIVQDMTELNLLTEQLKHGEHLRGPDALAAPETGADPADGIHSAGRGKRPDR